MCRDIIKIINELKPGLDVFEGSCLFEDGMMDSFDLLLLVSEIEVKLNVVIPGEGLIPENFTTPKVIATYISTL